MWSLTIHFVHQLHPLLDVRNSTNSAVMALGMPDPQSVTVRPISSGDVEILGENDSRYTNSTCRTVHIISQETSFANGSRSESWFMPRQKWNQKWNQNHLQNHPLLVKCPAKEAQILSQILDVGFSQRILEGPWKIFIRTPSQAFWAANSFSES
jgi:hypothetical protein